MFKFFENLISPFTEPDHSQFPSRLYFHLSMKIKLYLVPAAILMGLVATLELVMFNSIGKIVDWMSSDVASALSNGESAQFLRWLGISVALLPVVILLKSLLIHQTLFANFAMTIGWQAHRYLIGQSVSFFHNEFSGRIATKIMQSSMALRDVVFTLLETIFYVLVSIVGIAVVIGSSDYRFIVILLIWFGSYITILYYFIPRIKRTAVKLAHSRSGMIGNMVDTYTNIVTVKLFSCAKEEENIAKEKMQSFLNITHYHLRLVTASITSIAVINALLILTVIGLSIQLWTHRTITTGSAAVAIGLILKLYTTSQGVMWQISRLFENIGVAQDGIITISKPKEILDAPNATQMSVSEGAIVFDRVSFCYNDTRNVFNDFSLIIKPGEKLGLIGRSGSGKSTLLSLLLRFYDVQSGNIFVDGQNITSVTQDSLRRNISMVTQDISLLHRTIGENILYGNTNVSKDAMIDAAKRARAHDFILHQRDIAGQTGYDAHVGERGVKLSGGQRQRIFIARALLKDAPIVVLDEATSALDSETESIIKENLSLMNEGKTVIAIAHRLSTIAEMDRLVVIDEGKIVEEGSHSDLIALGGIYDSLWRHQRGGFLGNDIEHDRYTHHL
jgi:ATP-binding cassette, subfamily B, multidrug efflux pump